MLLGYCIGSIVLSVHLRVFFVIGVVGFLVEYYFGLLEVFVLAVSGLSRLPHRQFLPCCNCAEVVVAPLLGFIVPTVLSFYYPLASCL